jgi:hypothetical protein
VDYLRDGKTATVAMFTADGRSTISTNGKPDASLTPMAMAPTQDEITMIMAGVLPLALHPEPKRIAVIGWGSGLTTHTLLGSPLPEVVDTVEIERVMVEGARLYGDRVSRAYDDPRSQVRIEDARTFFSTGARKYDAIISEPSNPWVSGVASLFTREFYAFLKRHLEDGGMLVQWLHTYEIDDALVGTMMAALAAEFPETELYLTNTSDLLIVARMEPGRYRAASLAAPDSALFAELKRVGIERPELIEVRRIGSGEVLRNFVRMTGAIPHSDYFPTVSLQAPRTRFMRLSSTFLPGLVTNGLPVLDILDCRVPLGRAAALPAIQFSMLSDARDLGLAIADAGAHGRVGAPLRAEFADTVPSVEALLGASRQLATAPSGLRDWSAQVAGFARRSIGLLPAQDLLDVWIAPAWLPADAMAIPEVHAVMTAYASAARRDSAAMRRDAERVLELPEEAISPLVREQMLVIAMLGALGTDDRAAVPVLDERWGVTVARTADFAPIRSYLLAWADGPVPACAATTRGQSIRYGLPLSPDAGG